MVFSFLFHLTLLKKIAIIQLFYDFIAKAEYLVGHIWPPGCSLPMPGVECELSLIVTYCQNFILVIRVLA